MVADGVADAGAAQTRLVWGSLTRCLFPAYSMRGTWPMGDAGRKRDIALLLCSAIQRPISGRQQNKQRAHRGSFGCWVWECRLRLREADGV